MTDKEHLIFLCNVLEGDIEEVDKVLNSFTSAKIRTTLRGWKSDCEQTYSWLQRQINRIQE